MMLKAPKDYVWTSEKLSEKNIKELELIRGRAFAKGNEELVSLCDAEILRQKPPKRLSSTANKHDRPVRGIHLVCHLARGVVQNTDGTFWSGSWVVAKEHAEAGVLTKMYVALHEKHSEPSYLQGIVKDWRPAVRQAIYNEQEGKLRSELSSYWSQFQLRFLGAGMALLKEAAGVETMNRRPRDTTMFWIG